MCFQLARNQDRLRVLQMPGESGVNKVSGEVAFREQTLWNWFSWGNSQRPEPLLSTVDNHLQRQQNRTCHCWKSEVDLYLLNVLIRRDHHSLPLRAWSRAEMQPQQMANPGLQPYSITAVGRDPDPLLMLSGRLCSSIPVTAFLH